MPASLNHGSKAQRRPPSSTSASQALILTDAEAADWLTATAAEEI